MAGHWRYRRAHVVSWHARIVISCVRTAMWRPVWGMTNKLQNHTLSRPHIARRSENMQKLRDTLFPILLSFLRISVTQLVPCEGHRTHGHGRSAENTDDPQRIVKTLACRGETVEQLLLTLRGTFFFPMQLFLDQGWYCGTSREHRSSEAQLCPLQYVRNVL